VDDLSAAGRAGFDRLRLAQVLVPPEELAGQARDEGRELADVAREQGLPLARVERFRKDTAGWVGGLNHGPRRQSAALGLLTSWESRTKQFAGYYGALLHRPADPAGLAGWAGSGLDLVSVRIGIESSSEFFSNG
jgi:hypothetical protein